MCDPPSESKVIRLRWIYKIKRYAKGVITKYIARLVAKGYTQEYGVDWNKHQETLKIGSGSDYTLKEGVKNRLNYIPNEKTEIQNTTKTIMKRRPIKIQALKTQRKMKEQKKKEL